jgi:hypothetical protein
MRFLPARRAGFAAVLLAAAVALFALQGDGSATSFNPNAGVSLSSTAPGGNADITTTFSIPAPDANFSAVIGFTPGAWGIGACEANNPGAASRDCADAPIPDGAVAGQLSSAATLGLVSGPCSTSVTVEFTMLDATTNMSPATTFQTQWNDDNGDGVPNGAQLWPDYLSRILRSQPYPGGSPLQPIQRLYGQTNVAGANVSLNFVVFPPGITLNGITLDPSLGFPSVTVLQNTGDQEAVVEPSPITDFCTPLASSNTTLGTTQDNPSTGVNEGGLAYRTNPNSGGYNFVTYAVSHRAADNDGIENGLDPCPLSGNPHNWDPRGAATPGDTDADGIPDVCDPTPLLNTGSGDHDGDGFLNRGDNCPLAANANQKDADGDSIGDACDPNPSSPDGHNHAVCLVSKVNIGSGGPAADPASVPPCGTTTPTPATATPAPTPTLAPGQTPAPTPTPTLAPGQTPAPTPSLAPGQTPGPTPTPAPPGATIHGDVDCSGAVTAVDALIILRIVAQLSINVPPGCEFDADIDCSGEVTAIDALLILRYVAQLSVSQPAGCPSIGEPA